ncbi:hypothetical protein NHQ30_001872 [Ciborinia camelliae]|nr:hypothetical protein NHQ30_001872 [Ciborinia camelliae]
MAESIPPTDCDADSGSRKATGFTFIQVENNRGPRTAARSHVMREFWREKKLQKVKKIEELRKQESCSLRPKSSKRKTLKDIGHYHPNSGNRRDGYSSGVQSSRANESSVRDASREKTAQTKTQKLSQVSYTSPSQTMIPLSRTGIADVDPFSSLKFGEGPEIQKLLYHYCWITASSMDKEAAGTDFVRVGWLFSRVVWLDPEPIHVFMGFITHHMARLYGQKEPPIAIKNKTEGMRVINRRLNDPTQALSDGNIGAVASFTGHEVGFVNLVFASLGASTIQYEVAMMQARNDFCADFIRMVDGLERATGVIKSAASKITSQELWDNFSDRICSEAIGMSWLDSTEPTIDERRKVIWKCFRLAALIYLRMALQEFHTTPQLNGQYFRACKYRLLDTTTDWGRAIEMLTRVILRGERSNVERHRRAWYVANAMIELQEFGIEIWKMAEGTLFTYLGTMAGKRKAD